MLRKSLFTAVAPLALLLAPIGARAGGPTLNPGVITNPALLPLLAPPAGCTESSDDGWAALGLSGRPSWVSVCVERRLRITPALPQVSSDVAHDVKGYFADQGPGLAVGLVLDDGLYYSQGFGWRDAQKTARPDETTTFRAGSLSKVMTGTSLNVLIDDPANNMKLSDPADEARYLPELKWVCPQWTQPCARGSQATGVKLANLVSHTAGLANVMEQTNADVPTWLSDLKKSWLLFPPGSFNAYSGVGVEGAGLVVQRISGQPYPEAVDSLLFKPLGMSRSSMDPLHPAAGAVIAQRWQLNFGQGPLFPVWSFSKDDGIIGGDNQAMILPAGGLSTSVWDLSRFLTMWLTDQAPLRNGKPILKTATIQNAAQSLFPSNAPGPSYCNVKTGSTDANGFAYSQCGVADNFGVDWIVSNQPYIWHNGDEPGRSGSQTVVDQPGRIAATGLVSTEPYPNNNGNSTINNAIQPPGLDAGFINTVVWQHVLFEGIAGDGKTSWKGQPLPTGIARLLWLSGAEPPAGPPTVQGGPNGNVLSQGVVLPGEPNERSATPEERKPAKLPGPGGPTGPGQPPQTPLQAYEQSLLAQFTPGFLSANAVKAGDVQSFLKGLFGDVHACTTFRVRQVADASTASVRLLCAHTGGGVKSFDATLKVDAQGRIAELTETGATSEAY